MEPKAPHQKQAVLVIVLFGEELYQLSYFLASELPKEHKNCRSEKRSCEKDTMGSSEIEEKTPSTNFYFCFHRISLDYNSARKDF